MNFPIYNCLFCGRALMQRLSANNVHYVTCSLCYNDRYGLSKYRAYFSNVKTRQVESNIFLIGNFQVVNNFILNTTEVYDFSQSNIQSIISTSLVKFDYSSEETLQQKLKTLLVFS